MLGFCTYFDSNYMLKGIALYCSLEQVCNDFHLYVMALDKDSYDKLVSCCFKHMTVELLSDFETSELLYVKPTRTRAEYCWTCGPSIIWHFIKKYNLESCTYLDSDLMFYRSPKILFDEIGDNSVAITDHYAPYNIPQGRYCVQFMYFRNDEWGMKALKWWKDSCINWCYARREGDKYADQKYLEQFPLKFDKVHVIKTRGAGIASWNIKQYQFNSTDWTFTYNEDKTDIVFVHYHAVGIEVGNGRLILKPATFDINKNDKFLFDYYAELLVMVYKKFYGIEITNTDYKGRSALKKYYAKLKFALRDVSFIKFLYERYLRPEYKGYD